MTNIIGIRREDKNKWERRAPLAPEQVAVLAQEQQAQILVQASPIRAFSDAAYTAAGATVQEDIAAADVILAIKEIPLDLLRPRKTYLFFSHTIKGQPHNMPLLRRLLALQGQLIDYERISDAQQRRLLAFGEYAGLAGMLDTLRALGRRLAWEGFTTPLLDIKPTYEYGRLAAVQEALQKIARRIIEEGFPLQLTPLVIGVAGYGRVSQGAQAVLDQLPLVSLTPAELLALDEEYDLKRNALYKVVFREQDTVEPVTPGQPFDLAEFFRHPNRYRSRFARYLPHLAVLVNCIYWDTPYPRLVTKETARRLYAAGSQPRLRVIGDISCDIEGAIEPTLRAATPDKPTFVWDPAADTAIDGVAGSGPVIMAVDNLPCELPREATTAFGDALLPFIPSLAACDFTADFETCALPPALKRATIVYQGQLTPDYRYLEKFL